MDFEKLKVTAQEMLANFIDQLGLDGQYYLSTSSNCPIVLGKLEQPDEENSEAHDWGEFISPGSERLEQVLQNSNYDKETKELANQLGIILMNEDRLKDYNPDDPDPELLVSIIHEMLHSNRNILLFDGIRDGQGGKINKYAYSYSNGKFEQNTEEYGFTNLDASQEILKGNIDTSEKSINNYKDKSSVELEDDLIRAFHMYKHKIIDETLVELIAIFSCKLYRNKEKGVTLDIWDAIENGIDWFEDETYGIMCKIIFKHHDFELFNWMLDPISYSQGDMHYDFFGEYTKRDQSSEDRLLLIEFFQASIREYPDFNELYQAVIKEYYDAKSRKFKNDDVEPVKSESTDSPIGISDIEKVATSPTAIENLPIFKFMNRNREKDNKDKNSK